MTRTMCNAYSCIGYKLSFYRYTFQFTINVRHARMRNGTQVTTNDHIIVGKLSDLIMARYDDFIIDGFNNNSINSMIDAIYTE